ncbi:NAD(P)-dependent oxidoreductase [Pelagibius sp.]|uniref:NAD-dependent epimerase/dehydratase family protein n=1 Tax=Pelagibius sp. TaxID=1931238 RepID=UPI002634D685|nr:NAD-dependent epimerase/dehydratase family protein [Pelagibius sp.]
MTVFVTGATGVLGRPVVRLLRAAGREVRALCRSPENHTLLAKLGATPVEAELFDAGSMARAMQDCESLLHLATKIPDAAQMKEPGAWDENDRIRRDGTHALVEAAAQVEGLRSIVYPSVTFVYADHGDQWIDATSAAVDAASNLQSTLDAEADVARFAATAPERRGVVLRFGAFYGPASPLSRQTLDMARKGLAMPVAAAGAYKSFIWIDDAAEAVVAALDRAPSGLFDVVEDEPSTQRELRAALAAATGRRRLFPLPRWLLRSALPAETRGLLARSQRVSNTRFRKATGWRPSVPDQRAGWLRMNAACATGPDRDLQAENRRASTDPHPNHP